MNEPGVPFGRPPLSKTYLRGEEDLSGDPEQDADGEMAKAARLIARRARPKPSDLAREDRDLDGLYS